MRKFILILMSATLVACCFFIVRNTMKNSDKHFRIIDPAEDAISENREDEEAGQIERAELDRIKTLDPSLGYVPQERLFKAEKMAQRMRMARTAREQNLDALTWIERGPNNIAGRTRTVIIDKADPTGNTVLAGSVSGGLWRTTNFKSFGTTWTQVASFSSNLAINSLAQHPVTPSIMYAGTGEGYNNYGATRGLGIYKSTNGGLTWNVLPATSAGSVFEDDFHHVNKVLVYSNGDVYAAIKSFYCNRGGLMKSSDGGTSWTKVIGVNGNACNNSFDMVGYDIDMAINGDLYACIRDASVSDTTRGKIFRSSAGANVGNAGTWLNFTPPPPAGSYWQRIELAVSPTDANKVYAIMQGTGDAIGGMRVSNDKGGSWTDISNQTNWCDQVLTSSKDFSRNQAWYDLNIVVKPDDDQTVFASGIDIMKSTNGGAQWTQITQWANGCAGLPSIHADNHGVFHFPSSPNEFITVTDGGVYYSPDNGVSFLEKNIGYRTIQYYSAALHPTAASNYILGGSQDNGTHRFSTPALGNVTSAVGGDGGFCFIDQTDPTYQVASTTNANYRISRNGGVSFVNAGTNNNGRFINPTDYDDLTNIIYAGYTAGNLYRIDDITVTPLTTGTINFPLAGARQVSAVKVDPVVANRVWVGFAGTSNSSPLLFYVDNADNIAGPPAITQVPIPISGGIGNGQYISNIDVDPTNSNHLLFTISNYGVTSIYESPDLGANWVSLDDNDVNLPDVPVRWAIFLPDGFGFTGRDAAIGGIMIATEIGVWTTTAPAGIGTVWIQSSSMPNVHVEMLVFRNSDNTVAAATHGRGMFTTSLEAILPVNLLSFDGKLENSTTLLEWKTSAENNSSHFDVEKSTDGTNYIKIGKVTAAGNSNSERKYSFRDLKLSATNYYRLKMNDKDGKSKNSQVVIIKTNNSKQNVLLVNTPFNNFIKLRFSTPAKLAKVQLLTATGTLVSEKTFNDPWGEIQWNLPGHISQGAYVVRTTVDGQTFITKTVKQ